MTTSSYSNEYEEKKLTYDQEREPLSDDDLYMMIQYSCPITKGSKYWHLNRLIKKYNIVTMTPYIMVNILTYIEGSKDQIESLKLLHEINEKKFRDKDHAIFYNTETCCSIINRIKGDSWKIGALKIIVKRIHLVDLVDIGKIICYFDTDHFKIEALKIIKQCVTAIIKPFKSQSICDNVMIWINTDEYKIKVIELFGINATGDISVMVNTLYSKSQRIKACIMLGYSIESVIPLPQMSEFMPIIHYNPANDSLLGAMRNLKNVQKEKDLEIAALQSQLASEKEKQQLFNRGIKGILICICNLLIFSWYNDELYVWKWSECKLCSFYFY
jgi:hypothetical protein